MKKGKSYITLTDDDANHILIKKLKAKGINGIMLVYASHWSSNCGWDLLDSDKTCIGWNGWLGYTKKEALKAIEKIIVKDINFIYINNE